MFLAHLLSAEMFFSQSGKDLKDRVSALPRANKSFLSSATFLQRGKTRTSRRPQPFNKGLVNSAMENGSDLAHFVGKSDEFLGKQGLHAVGEGFVRLVMDFDEQAIRADGHRGS